MVRKKILIAGAIGVGNIGDEAILAGTLNLLKTNTGIGRDQIVVFSLNPNETINFHGVEAKRRNLLDLLTSSEVIIGGGELFQNLGNMAIKYSFLSLITKIFRKHLSFHAIGVSSDLGRLGKILTRFSMNIADCISVRDPKSKRQLLQLGVNKPITLIVDPSFSMKSISKEASRSLLEKEGIRIDSKKIRIALVSQYFENKKLNDEIYGFLLDFLKDALVKNPDLQIVFVPFNKHLLIPIDSDIIYGKWLERKLGTDQFMVLKNNYTPQQMMGILGLMDIVLSTRLHPIIFATKKNVPAIGIGVFEKTISFCTEHGIPLVAVNELVKIPHLINDLIEAKRQERLA